MTLEKIMNRLPRYINSTNLQVLCLDKFKANYKSHQIVYNSVSYVVLVKFAITKKDGSTGYQCRFVSDKDIVSAGVSIRVERSKHLKTKAVHTASHLILDENNQVKYTCSIYDCTCPDFSQNDLHLKTGFHFCKHTIASARLQGINSLHKLGDAVQGKFC